MFERAWCAALVAVLVASACGPDEMPLTPPASPPPSMPPVTPPPAPPVAGLQIGGTEGRLGSANFALSVRVGGPIEAPSARSAQHHLGPAHPGR